MRPPEELAYAPLGRQHKKNPARGLRQKKLKYYSSQSKPAQKKPRKGVETRQTLEVCRDEYFSAGKTKDLAEKLFVALLAVERLERKMARLNLRHGDLEMRHIFVTIIKGANNRYKGRTSAKLIDWETWQTESFRKDLIEWDKIKDTLLKTIGKEWYAKFCKKYRIPKKLPRIKIGTGLPKGKVRCPYCFEVVNIQELEYNEFAGAVICSDCAFHCNTEVPEYYDDALWE